MFEITDLHNHSLFGVDDGADSYETMCGMLDTSYNNNVRSICFTPHFNNRENDCTTEQIKSAFEIAKEYCEKNLPDMSLHLGSEMLYHYDCVDSIRENKLFTVANSKYVLVDFMYVPDVRSIIWGIQRLLNCGYIPIVAHVERYACLYNKPDEVQRMSALGAVIQINAKSLFYGIFSKRRSFCIKLLKEGLVDIVASDAHNLTSRSPNMREAAEFVISKFGYGYAEKIFSENQKRIISDIKL